MSEPDLEPSLAALLRAERGAPDLAPEAKAALWTRLEASTGGPPPSPRGGARAARFMKVNALRILLPSLGVAAAVGVASRPPAPQAAPTAAAVFAPPPSATATPEASAPASATAIVPSASPPPAPPRPRPRPPSDADLARERSLIEAARAAIRAGDAREGIAKLDEHARTFPRGRMSEEREALRVLALRASGRDADAANATASFRTRYPHSLLLGDR